MLQLQRLTQQSHLAVLEVPRQVEGWNIIYSQKLCVSAPLCIYMYIKIYVYLCSALDKLYGWVRRTYQRGECQAQIFFEDANLRRDMEAVTVAN